MPFLSRGTRRASGHALLWCALLWGAAETGGAVAPPCAEASPLTTVTTTAIKPVGDPDTPDEGGHTATVASTSSTLSAAALPAATPLASSPRRGLWAWLRAFFHLFARE